MKLFNIVVNGEIHLAVDSPQGLRDLSSTGFSCDMDSLVRGHGIEELRALSAEGQLPIIKDPVYANVLAHPGKLICVGLNYRSHAEGIKMQTMEQPVLFSKFSDALAPSGAQVYLPPWEDSYDYEAELVIVIGKEGWDLSLEEARDCIFGYTCGNDLSLRDAQMRSGQWLIGKTMPGFGPCGPCIVTADELDPEAGLRIRSYVNSQLRQDGSTKDMIFSCCQVISYASRYIKLEPGDLIFTGTPSGVMLECQEKRWLKPGDVVDVEIEGIGRLSNKMI